MNADFTHLHVHTQYSLLDSAIRLDPLFKKASEDKMEAIAMTDHGAMFGAYSFYSKAKEYGIKPILGCELYLAPGNRHIKSNYAGGNDELAPYATSRSGMHHLILLAKNEIGYRNLCKLVSIGYLEGFYYKPRIDKEVLAKYTEGLIATSACLKGEVTHQCIIGDMDRARELATWYRDAFNGEFYFELQQNGVPQQMLVNQRFQELGEELGIPLIATADCHYLDKEDAASQEVLMAISTGRTIDDPGHIEPQSDEFYFKTQDTMKQEFSHCPQAIENTMEIAKKCDFEFKLQDESGKPIYHLPKYETPPGESLEECLIRVSEEGLVKRLDQIRKFRGDSFTKEEEKPYWERIKKEQQVINDMGFPGYFLIVADFIQYSKDQEIPVGPGRGSGAGSLVAYSMMITDLDPIEHGLLFERFLNPERVSMPDFDIDFCMEGREKTIEYVTQKYGKEQVAQIITFGKLQARGVIRDVGRVFGMPVPEVDKIAKLIPNTLNITLKEALEQEPRLVELKRNESQVETLFEICQSIEGLLRHASIHAAGLIISNNPMVEHCPLYKGKEGENVVQFDMGSSEKIGLIKFDFLGLKTLTFLKKAQELVNHNHPNANLDLSTLNLKDKKMYGLLSKGDTLGIFQLESSGMQDLLRRVRPDVFDDITAINALYRPGPMGSGMLDDFIARKQGEKSIEYDFPQLESILKDTYGVIVYQEQVQSIAVKLANYTLGGADLLRRAMGKKKPEEMARQKELFMKGAKENELDLEKSQALFDLMAKFAGYGFNKSHAAAYALIACQTAYLKAHYPVEFYAGLLTVERENTDKITRYIADAKQHQINVLQPDVNESETDFTVLPNNQIRFGFGAIKGVGQTAIDEIIRERNSEGPFKDLFDFCSRTNTRLANKRVLEALVKAGAMDSLLSNRASLFAAIDEALEMGSAIQKTRDTNQASFADLFDEEASDFEHRKVSYPDKRPWDRLQELKFEKDTIGFYVSGHPLDDFEYEIKRYTSLSVSNAVRETSSKDTVFVAGSICAFREILTKRGDRMAFASLEDQFEQIEMVIFPDAYLSFEDVLKSGEPIWVRSKLEVGDSNNENKLILSQRRGDTAKVLPLRHAYEEMAREVHLHLHVGQKAEEFAQETLVSFQNLLNEHHVKEGAPVFVHLKLDGRARTVLRLKNRVPIQREIMGEIQHFFKTQEVRLEFQ